MNPATLVTTTLAPTSTPSVRCALAGMQDLLPMLRDVVQVSPRRRGGRVTQGMAAVATGLEHVARLRRGDADGRMLERLQHAIETEIDRICLAGNLYFLAGLSADGSILVLRFADRPDACEEPL